MRAIGGTQTESLETTAVGSSNKSKKGLRNWMLPMLPLRDGFQED